MFRRLLLIFTISAVSICSAQDPKAEPLTAAKCFSVAPTAIFDMLDNNVRLDMLDYYNAGVSRMSDNSVGGQSYIVDLTPYNIDFVAGTDIDYQLFVLNPEAQYPIIGIIETLSAPLPDSMIKFYTSKWAPLDGILPNPNMSDWVKPEAKKLRGDIERTVPFVMAKYAYNDSTSQLVMTNVMDQYYSKYDTPKELKYLKSDLTYKWDGKKFKLVR